MTAATPEWHPHLRMALASCWSPTPTHKTLLHPDFVVKLLSNPEFLPLPPSPLFRPQFPSAPSPWGSHHHPEPRGAGRYRRQAPNKTKHKGLGEGRKGGRGHPRACGGGRAEAATGRRCCAALRGRGHEGPGPGPAVPRGGAAPPFRGRGAGWRPRPGSSQPGVPPCALWGGQTARGLECQCGRRGGKPCGSAASAPELEKRLVVLSWAASSAWVLPSQRIEVFLPERNGQAGFIYLCISPHTHLAGVEADAVAEQEGKSRATEKQGRRLKQHGDGSGAAPKCGKWKHFSTAAAAADECLWASVRVSWQQYKMSATFLHFCRKHVM